MGVLTKPPCALYCRSIQRGVENMTRIFVTALACAWLAGCAVGQPESQAQQAETAACTAQGDATYNADTIDEQARTSQNGLLFAPMPNHAFDAEHLGAEHVRDSQITACEQNGNTGGPMVNGTQVVTPHIIGTP
jgi:hypothetical protein